MRRRSTPTTTVDPDRDREVDRDNVDLDNLDLEARPPSGPRYHETVSVAPDIWCARTGAIDHATFVSGLSN